MLRSIAASSAVNGVEAAVEDPAAAAARPAVLGGRVSRAVGVPGAEISTLLLLLQQGIRIVGLR